MWFRIASLLIVSAMSACATRTPNPPVAATIPTVAGEVATTGTRSGDSNVASTGTNGDSTMLPLPGTFIIKIGRAHV